MRIGDLSARDGAHRVADSAFPGSVAYLVQRGRQAEGGLGGGRSRPPHARQPPRRRPARPRRRRTARTARTARPRAPRWARTASPRRSAPAAPRSAGSLLYLLLIGLVGMLVAAGGFVYLYKTTELPDPNADFETNTSFVYYNDGENELGRYAIQNRDAIPYDEMPQDVKDAVVAAENRTFWSDNGIDVKGIVRAAFNNASGNATQGASTITQQYIKILYLTQERSYTRKLKEAILSLKLRPAGQQAGDPRGLPQHHLLRPRRLRHPGGRAGLLRQVRLRAGPQGERGAGEHHQQPDATSTRPTARTRRIALRERYRYVLDGMATTDDISDADGRSRRRGSCRSSRDRGHRRQVRRPERPRADHGEERAHDAHQRGDRRAVHRGRDRRRRPAGDHDVHPEGDGRGRGGRRRGPAGGQGVQRQEPAHRRGQRAGRHRGGARHLRRPGLPRQPDQLGGRGRAGGLVGEAVRTGRRAEGGLLAQGHLRRQLALRAARTATRSATRATTTTARRSACSRPPRTRSTPPSPT